MIPWKTFKFRRKLQLERLVKDQKLTTVQDKITLLDNKIRDNEENLAKVSLKQNNLSNDINAVNIEITEIKTNKSSLLCLLYTSPSPRDRTRSRMPSSA